MGLDAKVYCNCFEKGFLKKHPLTKWNVKIDDDGSRYEDNNDLSLKELMEFDEWNAFEACEHKDGEIIHHRIGNISTVAFLRGELNKQAEKFPVVLGQVIYNGMHSGDYVLVSDLSKLKRELTDLESFHSDEPEADNYIRHFELQLRELVEHALEVNKPISF